MITLNMIPLTYCYHININIYITPYLINSISFYNKSTKCNPVFYGDHLFVISLLVGMWKWIFVSAWRSICITMNNPSIDDDDDSLWNQIWHSSQSYCIEMFYLELNTRALEMSLDLGRCREKVILIK